MAAARFAEHAVGDSAVIAANIAVHSRMAATYDAAEPHFRPENRAKVRSRLEDLRRRAPGGRLIDFGCGTGFILGLAHDLFDELHGIDATPAMLERVDLSPGNIKLHRALAEKTPFPDGHFHAATAYSFIHHLQDYAAMFREAYRVLAPGGVCYIDCEPNRLFWEAMAKLDGQTGLSAMVLKARDSVLAIDAKVEAEYGIPQETFRNAEYGKSILGGVDPAEALRHAQAAGFRIAEVHFDWFLGQAEVMHGDSFAAADKIETYLHGVAPVANHLFKYLRLELTK